MISTNISNQAHQLGVDYGLGEYIREYRTNKHSEWKTLTWVMLILYAFMMIFALFMTHFIYNSTTAFLYIVFTAIMIIVALGFFVTLFFVYPATVYIYSLGFIKHDRTAYQAVRWEQVEYVLLGQDRNIIYLTNSEKVILGKYIERRDELAQEIELKARLMKRPEGLESLEQQFELARNRQPGREQEKENISEEKQDLITHEKPEEAFMLGEKYQMGNFLATYHAGFKGISRIKSLVRPLHYVLLLTCVLVVLNIFFPFSFLPAFLHANSQFTWIMWLLIYTFIMPRAFALFIRLHLYAEGFIYIEGGTFEVVRWEQVEKIIYHKPMPILSPPLCHIYLTTNDKLAISGYMHQKKAIKPILAEYISNEVEAG